MLSQWEESSLEVYFNDIENEKVIKQTFTDLKENVTLEQVQAVQTAVAALVELPAQYAIVVDKTRYIPA